MGSQEPVHYKVAEAARLAGVSASTLRLWETQGLVEGGRQKLVVCDAPALKRLAENAG